MLFFFFFFNDTATTEIYTLSLHDALPICEVDVGTVVELGEDLLPDRVLRAAPLARLDQVADGQLHAAVHDARSEEHTSELQSLAYLVCRLLLEKKKES